MKSSTDNHVEGVAGSSSITVSRSPLPPKHSFWLLVVVLALFFFPSSAPSPLYSVYETKFMFSSITLTAIFATYAVALLVTLLFAGKLSDHLGRRPILLLALVVQIVSMFAFIAAQGVGLLYLGRALQGVAIGLAAGTIAAWLLDLKPPDKSQIASLMGSVAPMAGLAGGAFLSGLLVQYGPDPLTLVFWLLTIVFIIALALVSTVPDVSLRTPGWFQSLKPSIGIPAGTRSLFIQLTPSLIAAWAMGGLYLSLGPSLVLFLLHSSNHFLGGLVIVSISVAASVSAVTMRALDARLTTIITAAALIVGVGVSLLSISTSSGAGFYMGGLITGLGFGPVFSGTFRRLAPLAPPDKRGSLLSSIFVVSYLAFGVPVVVAGVAITFYRLIETTTAYGLVVMALAALTGIEAYRTHTNENNTVSRVLNNAPFANNGHEI